MQLRIVWEEILRRFDKIEVMGETQARIFSFRKGYEPCPCASPLECAPSPGKRDADANFCVHFVLTRNSL